MGKIRVVGGRLTKCLTKDNAPTEEGVTPEIWNRTNIVGKPILVRHNWSNPGPIGKFTKSWIERDEVGDYWGCVEGAIEEDKPGATDALREVDQGILHSWSVSVIQGDLSLGPADLNREVLEGSLVPDPKESGTQVVVRHSADGKPITVQHLGLKVVSSAPVPTPAAASSSEPAPQEKKEPAVPITKEETPADPEKKAEKTEQKPVDTLTETKDTPKVEATSVPATLQDTEMADAKATTDANPAPNTAVKPQADAAPVKKPVDAKPAATPAKKAPQLNTGSLKVPPKKEETAPTQTEEAEADAEMAEAGEEEIVEEVEEAPVEPPKKAVPTLKPTLKAATKPAAAKPTATPAKKDTVAEKPAAAAVEAAETEGQEADAPVEMATKIAELAKKDPTMAAFLQQLADKQKAQDEYIANDKAEKAKREAEAREKLMSERAEQHANFIAATKEAGIDLDEVEEGITMQIWQSDDPAHQVIRGVEDKYISRIAELTEEVQALKKARVQRPQTGSTPIVDADVLTEALKRVNPAAVVEEPKRKVTLKTGTPLEKLPSVAPGQKIYSHSKSASKTSPANAEWAARLQKTQPGWDPMATLQSQAQIRAQFKIPAPST